GGRHGRHRRRRHTPHAVGHFVQSNRDVDADGDAEPDGDRHIDRTRDVEPDQDGDSDVDVDSFCEARPDEYADVPTVSDRHGDTDGSCEPIVNLHRYGDIDTTGDIACHRTPD